jgi:hypothetical protein
MSRLLLHGAEGQWSSSILSSLHYTTHGLEGQAKVIVAPRHVDMGLLTVGYSEMPGMQVSLRMCIMSTCW